MKRQTQIYVTVVSMVAAVLAAAVYLAYPRVNVSSQATDVVLLSLLAFAGEALTILLPRSAAGSMGFIPYFALALVVPAWPAVAGVIVIKTLVEIRARREPIKFVFNVAAHAIMQAVAILVYRGLGGQSFLEIARIVQVIHVTAVAGGPALIACAAALTTNNMLVFGVVAISTHRPVTSVWRENHRSTFGIDVLAAPLVFVFAWVYAAFGVIFTATLWIPILGLRQLQRTNLELEKTNQELLELMVKSLEARDAYTSGHSRRVQRYSTIIARAFGLSASEIEKVSKAALLHDVGKIHDKYAAVLAKTDKLTSEEWDLIQEHAADGATLVATMTHLRDVVPAIRGHHENWDGTGYPDGLAGDLIPLAARIIRFADTIDAMTTERPYRAAMMEHQVRAELVRCRGTQFDPAITDRLLSSPLWPTMFTPKISAVELPRQRFALIASTSGRSKRA